MRDLSTLPKVELPYADLEDPRGRYEFTDARCCVGNRGSHP